jgi:hypothetical protein
MTAEPQLPATLQRLGDDLERAYQAEELQQRNRNRRRRRRWLTVAAATTLTAVPAAVATRAVLESSQTRGSGAAAIVGRGTAGAESWRLSVHLGERGLCMRLTISVGAGTQSEICGPERPLDVRRATSRQHAFVFGRAPARAAQVRLTVAGRPAGRAQVIVPTAAARRTAGLGPDARFYIVALASSVPANPPPRAQAFDAQGRLLVSTPGS